MNWTKNIIAILICGICLMGALLGIFAFSPSDEKNDSQKPIEQEEVATVTSFPIPKSVSFAGQEVSLTRCDLRERFDKELSSIVYRHSFTLQSIKNANRYFPIIEPILKENNIPTDFKYLALIESNFDIRAVSPVKAVGFWQFMPETAKIFKLEITDEVDERYNIKKSTEAACQYFKKAYQKFGDWLLVAASYNAGMGRISSELSKQQADSFADLFLNQETSRYVFRILSMKYFLKNPQTFGYKIPKSHFYQQISCDTVTVTGVVENWADFAKEHKISFAMLKEYNLWIRTRKLDNKKNNTYKICIPKQKDLEYNPSRIKIYQENWAVDDKK